MIRESDLLETLRRSKSAAKALRSLSSAVKNEALGSLAELLIAQETVILQANAKDLETFDREPKGAPAFRDRLTLNSKRIAAMAESLRQVVALPDPVGEVVENRTLPNGLKLSRVRSPLGLIFMIFESRPNVAIEALSLAFKSGNAAILRGGKESRNTVSALYRLTREALQRSGAPVDSLWGIEDYDRAITDFLLRQKNWIDVVVPRGGQALIDHVVKSSSIPVIKHDRGMCHVFVNADANLRMALSIVKNSKTQRPGVCNAMETVLVHRSVAKEFISALYEDLKPLGVRWFACPETLGILKGRGDVSAATAENWDTEYLDLKMNCKVVGSLDEALEHIERHGSNHSEAIVTASEAEARRFQQEVDAAAVYWNASTRFTDGFEFGLGGEIGISTQKLHVRGPVGLRELTSTRWLGEGSGQIKG